MPDLQPLEKNLASLKKAVYQAFPSFRWEASYNAISYRRVRIHLDVFKVEYYAHDTIYKYLVIMTFISSFWSSKDSQ